MLTWYLIIDDREHEPEYHITDDAGIALAYASQLAGQHPTQADVTFNKYGEIAASIGGVHVHPVWQVDAIPVRVREAQKEIARKELARLRDHREDAEAKE